MSTGLVTVCLVQVVIILRHLESTYSIILGDMISQLTSWPLALRIFLFLFFLCSLTSERRHPGQIQLKLLAVWCPKCVAVFFSKEGCFQTLRGKLELHYLCVFWRTLNLMTKTWKVGFLGRVLGFNRLWLFMRVLSAQLALLYL